MLLLSHHPDAAPDFLFVLLAMPREELWVDQHVIFDQKDQFRIRFIGVLVRHHDVQTIAMELMRLTSLDPNVQLPEFLHDFDNFLHWRRSLPNVVIHIDLNLHRVVIRTSGQMLQAQPQHLRTFIRRDDYKILHSTPTPIGE